jgi:hypothetical protein
VGAFNDCAEAVTVAHAKSSAIEKPQSVFEMKFWNLVFMVFLSNQVNE